MVPNSCIYLFVAEIVFVLTGPLLGFAILRIRNKATFTSAFSGIGSCLVFSIILNSLVNYLFTGYFRSFGELVQSNIVVYTLYFGIMTALFDVGGTYFVMKFVMKQSVLRVDSISYGICFGGVMMLISSGIGSFVNMTYASLLNGVGRDDFIAQITASDSTGGIALEEAEEIVDGLLSLRAGDILLDILDVVICISMQVFIAILVYYAVKYNDIQMLGVAAAARFIFVVPGALVVYNVLTAGAVALLIEAMMAAGTGYLAVRQYKNMKQKML